MEISNSVHFIYIKRRLFDGFHLFFLFIYIEVMMPYAWFQNHFPSINSNSFIQKESMCVYSVSEHKRQRRGDWISSNAHHALFLFTFNLLYQFDWFAIEIDWLLVMSVYVYACVFICAYCLTTTQLTAYYDISV